VPSSSIEEDVQSIQDPVLRRRAERLLSVRERYRKGLVSVADSNGNVRWIPWQEATAQGATGTPDNKLTQKRITQNAAFKTPSKIVKRSDRQRVESLAKRFWDQVQLNPAMAPMILKEMQTEYWKAGQPVSFEDMKLAAIELLKKAAEAQAK